MAEPALHKLTVREVAEAAASNLVGVRHWGDSSYVRLPLIYPSGAAVNLKLSHVKGGFRVSDGGLAFREIERFGADRAFAPTARKVIEDHEIQVDRRTVFADVAFDEVEAAIYEVGIASHQIAEQVVARAAEVHAEDVADALQQRLLDVFGAERVKQGEEVIGSSSTAWKVSAVTRTEGHVAIFQAVSQTPMSLFRTSAAFHDLALLDQPPSLIAVVENKAKFGAKNLGILSQAGKVIEVGVSDATYRRAAA